MVKWLSQEWLDETVRLANDQPERPGVSATMQYEITGGPEGDVSYYWILVEGKVADAKLGKLEGAQITLTTAYGDALNISKGLLDPNAAFMQGRVKTAGDVGKLMSLMPITNAPEYKQMQADLLAATEF